MAKWLLQNDLIPDLILCSSASRTRETVALLQETWQQDRSAGAAEIPVAFTRELYQASPDELLYVIRGDGCDAASLLVVGHNPTMSQFGSWLIGESIDMPTAAVAVFELPLTEWSKLRSPEECTLAAFAKPKSLPPS